MALVAVASGPVLVGRQAEVGGALVAQRRLPLDLALPTSALSLPLHQSSEHLAGVLSGGGQCLGWAVAQMRLVGFRRCRGWVSLAAVCSRRPLDKQPRFLGLRTLQQARPLPQLEARVEVRTWMDARW